MAKIMQGFPVPPGNRVPFEDWDRAPWNRWSFQHVREILPTADVWRGQAETWALPQRPRDLDALRFADAAGVRRSLEDFFTTQYTDGLIVLKGGAVAHESYHNGMDHRSLHLSQSVAKSITACVAGILVDRGQLDPEAHVTEYLPELEATAYRGVDAPGCIWDQILTLTETERPHGEKFDYRSIETDVIAHCMERVTETRLPELISRELWQPLGCEESASFTVDRAGYALASGGFNACAAA